jgi:hypothetical protein
MRPKRWMLVVIWLGWPLVIAGLIVATFYSIFRSPESCLRSPTSQLMPPATLCSRERAQGLAGERALTCYLPPL